MIDKLGSFVFTSAKANTPSSSGMKTSTQIRQPSPEDLGLIATAVMDGGLTQSPVSVLNLSPTGAQIEVHSATELPPTLTLAVKDRLETCEVIWQFAQFAGLRFMGGVAVCH